MSIDAPSRAAPDRGAEGDVVIVGGGLAGLFCALRMAPRPVTVLAAAPIGEGASSAWAQGGIAAAISEGDSVDSHLTDTVAVGGGIVDATIARGMISEAGDRIADLLALGVPFDRDLDGRLVASREAAHSRHRVIHVRGDMAGKAIMAALIAAVRKTPSIRVVENYIGERLATEDGRVIGVHARPRGGTGASVLFPSAALVLATGGAGHLFAVTTNPLEATAAGIGMAARAGAVIADAEFVQFHPTALDVGRDPAPLATEVLRGEGATLIDADGRRFMLGIDPRAELAPRDIVARAVHRMRAAGKPVYLDCRKAVGAAFAEHFPTVYQHCVDAGIDPERQPIPIAPAAHYHMGGILTGADGRSSLPGLWACGEAASTGVHGANRLASNSLLEAVVFAARIADDIKASVPFVESDAVIAADAAEAPPVADSDAVRRLRQTMSEHVGVERDHDGLVRALAVIQELSAAEKNERVLNMLVAARLMASAALIRTESRGGHYRSDYPEADPAQQHRSYLTLAEADRIADRAAAEALAPAS